MSIAGQRALARLFGLDVDADAPPADPAPTGIEWIGGAPFNAPEAPTDAEPHGAAVSDELTGIEHNKLAMRLLGGAEPEPELPPATDAPPDFDGGTREPAPAPDEPEKDHDELVKNLLAPRESEPWPG